MTAVPAETRAAPTVATDPYRYGWRYVRRELPDGGEEWDQVPLTLEDVLHPQEGDFIVQTELHHRVTTYLYNVLRARLASNPGAVVLSDCRIAWDVPELRPLGPDIAVIFGVRERRNWGTFDVARAGASPALVIEVTSPETRALDLVAKLDAYDLAGVPLYVVIDITERRGQRVPRLLGYRRTPTVYAAVAPDERGWLWLEPVRLWLGVDGEQVVCYDETGAAIEDYVAVAAARAEAEARVRELEAELRRLRGDENRGEV